MAPSANASAPSAGDPAPGPQPGSSLPAAILLAFAGGNLDAFLYLTHDKVFAGAMTGNDVLSGIALLSGKSSEALHHLNPLGAFVCGVFLAELLHERLKERAATVALGCEMIGVLAASFLPRGFPGELFIFLLAFLAAFQVTSFRKLDQQSYNSTFITGNMRSAVVGFCEMFDPAKRAKGMVQARSLSLVVLSFLAGATASAVLTSRLGNRSLWVTFLALLAVFVSVARRARVAGATPGEYSVQSGA